MVTLVTGGAGFLGSHLCERLLEQGQDVVCMDNFFTGRRRNVAHLLENPRFELVRHDVIDPFKVEVDRIFNLACPASPVHYQYNPIKTVKTSVMGAINCLGLAKRVEARILRFSRQAVICFPCAAVTARTNCGTATASAAAGTRGSGGSGKKYSGSRKCLSLPSVMLASVRNRSGAPTSMRGGDISSGEGIGGSTSRAARSELLRG